MTQQEFSSYRFSSGHEPSDEMLNQLMENAARKVRESNHEADNRYFDAKSIINCTSIAKEVDRLYVYDNSIDDSKARPLFRLRDGVLGKQYVDEIPEWARNILPER